MNVSADQRTRQQQTFSSDSLSRLYHSTVPAPLRLDERYVIFADLHMGDGGKADDFLNNAAMFAQVLQEHYLAAGYSLVLNGDVEELQRFSLAAIRARWSGIYRIFNRFDRSGRFHKLVGNHDMSILNARRSGYRVGQALRLNYNGDNIFIFHGHQVSRWFMQHNRFVGLTLKYFATPLRIKNYEVSHNSRKRFETERLVYEFSSRERVLSIIGHTHRPLFESMSKVDSLKFELEQLCRTYPQAGDDERSRIEAQIARYRSELLGLQRKRSPSREHTSSLYNEHLVVPCLFNSGWCTGLTVSDRASISMT